MATSIISLRSTLLALSILVICDAVIVKEVFKWSYINYTWPTPLVYQYYFQTRKYIPENNIPSNIKIYRNMAFITLGRYFPGTPVTLGYVKMNDTTSSLLTPYPNWDLNVQSDCTTLQNVNAIDIDKNGIMWILDGLRINALTKCPPKLVLLNITSSKIRSIYEFPREGDRDQTYLFDLVVNGNYAYITDSNVMDPGIIVYSKEKNASWKLRHPSMFPDSKGVTFSVGNSKYNYYHGVGPITMTPRNTWKTRFIFYSSVSSQNIYKLNVNFVQNIDIVNGGIWRDYVHLVGAKVNQSYNYAMKDNGDLYFCLMNKHALAKWSIEKEFRTASYVVQDNPMLKWCTGSTFHNDNLYIISGNLVEYLVTVSKPTMQKNLFRLLKVSTSNKSKRNAKLL